MAEKEVKLLSPIWNYFTLLEKDNEGKVSTQCKVEGCKVKLAYHTSTSAMIKHIELKHAKEYAEYETKVKKPSAMKQSTLTSDEYKIKDLSLEKSKAITYAIGRYIASDMRPLSTVEGEAFKALIHFLEPRYEIPSRKTFSTDIIPTLYQKAKTSVQIELCQVEGYAITFDYWSSYSNKAFLTTTLHYINKNFDLRNLVLKTEEVKESHSGKNTATIISKTLEEYYLKTGGGITKPWAVSDSAANMKKAAHELGWPYVPCFAHILHNSVSKCFEDRNITPLIDKVKNIAIHFRSSPRNSNTLIEMQQKLQLPQIKLKLNVITRWNSVFDMIDRVLKNQSPIVNISLEDQEVQELNLTMNEWQDLSSLRGALEPFKEITDFLSTNKMSSISTLNPLICNIKESFLKINPNENMKVKAAKLAIEKGFVKRLIDYKSIEDFLDLASLLDPRFKKLRFLSENRKSLVEENLLIKCKEYKEYHKDYFSPEEEKGPENLKRVKKTENLSKLFGSIYSPQADISEEEKEVKNYLREEPISIEEDPLIWWRTNSYRFPILSFLAKDFLAVPATSVPSEQIFSKAGHIMNVKRSSLGSSLADKLIFLAHNK